MDASSHAYPRIDLDALERLLLEPEFENERTMDEIIESGRETTRLVLAAIAELRVSRRVVAAARDYLPDYETDSTVLAGSLRAALANLEHSEV